MQLGTDAWLQAVRKAINASEDFASKGQQWDRPLGLGFVDAEGDTGKTRYAVLDLEAGTCNQARAVDQETFEALPYALTASYERWQRILDHDLDLMRCIVLNRVELRGDRFTALRFLPAAKALLDACSSVTSTSSAT